MLLPAIFVVVMVGLAIFGAVYGPWELFLIGFIYLIIVWFVIQPDKLW
jgi:hypothetical protein